MPRASFDLGFTDERVPGTLLEVSLAPGASLDLAPLHSDWIDTCNTPTLVVMPEPVPRIVFGTHAGRVSFIVGALWRLIGRR
jgi:hypothetical protein